jgi:hypothetical protein
METVALKCTQQTREMTNSKSMGAYNNIKFTYVVTKHEDQNYNEAHTIKKEVSISAAGY